MISYQVVFIAAIIGVLPVVGWLWFIARQNKLTLENGNFLLKVFFWGVLTAIPASAIEIWISDTETGSQVMQMMQQVWSHQGAELVSSFFLSILLVALIEEISKGVGIFAAIKSAKKTSKIIGRINPTNLGMMLGMIVGLAFGVTENGVYFASSFGAEVGSNFLAIVLLRFLLSTSAHIIYSGLMGAFLAEAMLLKTGTGKAFSWLLALLIPVAIHTCFNLLVSTAYSWLALPLIVLGFLLLWLKYWTSRKNVPERIMS